METPKIYVVNLNSYNNGRTRGEWYELPVDFSRIKSDLLLDVEHGEEYAIHDFENVSINPLKVICSATKLAGLTSCFLITTHSS